MRLKLFIVCLLSSISSIFAQAPTAANQGSVTGKIIDKSTKEPVGYASVSIKEGEKVVTGAISQENGNFSISNLELKSYTLEVQFIGYKKYSKAISLSSADKSINVGTIAIESEATQLEGVNVVADRTSVVQKIDRKVYHIGKDIIASGTTASDILNNIPTVSVDAQTKEISLRGNANVRVLIDGKPSNIDPAQLLQQIPSSSIKDIETITNPSSKYNPEGMSGIINIVLHKNANDGFNGSVNTGVTFGITPKTNSALNLNYKVGKVNVYSNYGFNHGINANHGYVNSENPTKENLMDFKFRNRNTSHLLKLGLDYYINDKNTFSFYTNQNLTYGNGDGSNLIDYKDNTTVYLDDNPNVPGGVDPTDPTTYILRTNVDNSQSNITKTSNKSQTYDLDFKHSFEKKGENIEFQANYSNTKNDENTGYQNTDFLTPTPSYSSRRNLINGEINYGQFNLDYVNPISETAKIEIGAESRLQHISNDFKNIATVQGTHNTFDFNRDIHAVYTNYSKQWKKWSAQAGVRLEDYAINANFEKNQVNPTDYQNLNVKDHIFTAYPSAFISYVQSDKNTFNFNYSRRVDRPSVGQISPIREWTTPLMESRGNPDLRPQFTNSFEVNYTRNAKLGTITAGVFYRSIHDEISRVIFNDPNDASNNRKILSYSNFNNNNAYGVESSANLKFTKWWAANTSVDAYFKTVKGTIQNTTTGSPVNAQINNSSFNARINNTFTVNKDLRIQLFGMYRGRDVSLQYVRRPMYKGDIGATYNVLKGKGTVTLRLNDMFKTMRFAFDGNIPYHQNGAFYWESRTLYVGFNYMFGGGKNKALQRKQRDANETQGGGMF